MPGEIANYVQSLLLFGNALSGYLLHAAGYNRLWFVREANGTRAEETGCLVYGFQGISGRLLKMAEHYQLIDPAHK
jgi:hypothetical protein